MENIVLHVYYEGTDENLAAFVKKMKESGVLGEVRNEEGCLQYEYFTPVEGKGLLLLEKWRDAECLKKHSEGEPMKKLKAVKAECNLASRFDKNE